MLEQLNNPELMQNLQKEIPVITAHIRSVYAELDKKFHLNGANIPITFGFDKELYAHYMQYNYPIPKEYEWQPGIHGSAWKYCCSLVGASPTPYYKAGEALMEHNYEKALKNPIHDKTVPMRDTYRREKKYQSDKNSVVQYEVGETVNHPKFGEGTVEKIEQLTGSVRLHIRFGEEIKMIDQKWLLQTKYHKS